MTMQHPFLPNQFECLGKYLYVAQNHPDAADTNPGSPDKPFKTISAAAKHLKTADRVYIDAGTYREEIPLAVNGHYYVPNSQIHFHALNQAQVYIKGSDRFTAPWQAIAPNLHQAPLPAALFTADTYNPYALSLITNDTAPARPCPDQPQLPLTRGQLYVNHLPYEQLSSIDAVKNTTASFIITADGKNIIAHFSPNHDPANAFIELITRRRCFNPLFTGKVMIQTHGICIEHAAEPGPFCKSRHVSHTRAQDQKTIVEKRFCWPGAAGNGPTLMEGQPAYLAADSDTIVASLVDDTQPVPFTDVQCLEATSDDGGKTWNPKPATRRSSKSGSTFSYTRDDQNNILIRHWREYPQGTDPHGAFGNVPHNVLCQMSRDQGQSWSSPQLIDDRKTYAFSILPLDNGQYLWPCTTNTLPAQQGHHSKFFTLIGTLSPDAENIDWQPAGQIEVSPQESDHGLDEPSLAQFPDGRVIAFFRQGSKMADQDHPGITSVKLWSISNDNGQTWSHPQPLCDENDRYLYSPRAYHLAFRSIKNNRVYIAMNVASAPCHNCDPRTHLYLVEVDADTLRAPRDNMILIEAAHPEHHHYVRFSNFQFLQERQSRNPLIFMKLAASEYCPIFQGYDQNMYRYEIKLPD